MWKELRYEKGFFGKKLVGSWDPRPCMHRCPKTDQFYTEKEGFVVKCLSPNGCCWECAHAKKESLTDGHLHLKGCNINKPSQLGIQRPDTYCKKFLRGLSQYERDEKARAGRRCLDCAHLKEEYVFNGEWSEWETKGCYKHPEIGRQRGQKAYCKDFVKGQSRERIAHDKKIAEAKAKKLQAEKEREDKLYSSFGYRE